MVEAQSEVVALDVPHALRDSGKRSYKRFVPVAALPARMTLSGDSGWRFGNRPVGDISVGGASFFVNFWESRRVRVGDEVQLRLLLADLEVQLSGRCMHMSGAAEWWAPKTVGIAFRFDRAYENASPKIVSYLLRLRKLIGRGPRR